MGARARTLLPSRDSARLPRTYGTPARDDEQERRSRLPLPDEAVGKIGPQNRRAKQSWVQTVLVPARRLTLVSTTPRPGRSRPTVGSATSLRHLCDSPREQAVVDERPKPPVADGPAETKSVHDVLSGHRADDRDPRHDRPIPIGNHWLLASTNAHEFRPEPITPLHSPNRPKRPNPALTHTMRPPHTPQKPPAPTPQRTPPPAARPPRLASTLFCFSLLPSSDLSNRSLSLSSLHRFTVHPVSPPHHLLCRALTPPEHPIVFGRGQGPAQATNPHKHRDRVWTRNPHPRPHRGPSAMDAVAPEPWAPAAAQEETVRPSSADVIVAYTSSGQGAVDPAKHSAGCS